MRESGAVPLVCLLAVGCGGNVTSAFPAGLQPLDPEIKAAWPAAVEDDLHPEQVNFASGNANGYAWVHGAAFVHAPLGTVWEAMRDPEVSVDRRMVTSWTVTLDVETGYDYSYRLHNTVNSTITVDFENTWRHDAIEGTKDAPQAIAAVYQKTWGTSFVTLLAGSFVARQLDDGTSSLTMIEHLNALGQGPATAQSTLGDYYASILAHVRMQPLPTY